VFAHVDHAAGAAAVSLPLRPTDLLLFCNAKGGTPLMRQAQTIGIDLPLEALSGRMKPARRGSLQRSSLSRAPSRRWRSR
jgi:hypothetical protein